MRSTPFRTRIGSFTFVAALLCGPMMLIAPSARAQSISLDADYTGGTGMHYIVPAVAALSAYGTNASAPLGLTQVDAYTEGFFDGFGDQLTFTQSDYGFLTWTAVNGDKLSGSFHGQGTMRAFSGTFDIVGGTGGFTNAAGGGTFSIVAPTWDFSGGPTPAPATFSIRGAVAPTAVPEPGSAALLAAGIAPLAAFGFRRRHRRTD
jgi:hypothetical protein